MKTSLPRFFVVLSWLGMAFSFFFADCRAEETLAEYADAPEIRVIRERGLLIVGVRVDVPGFGYDNPETGKLEGLEIDLARLLATRILGDEDLLVTQDSNLSTRMPLLDDDEIDLVIATFTITEERRQLFNFSRPYYVDGVGMMVRQGEGIERFDDLKGKAIGLAGNTTTRQAVLRAAEKAGFAPILVEFEEYPAASAALAAGEIDCLMTDASVLEGYLREGWTILPERLSEEAYGIASRKNHVGLARLVDTFISELEDSGALESLRRKWRLR